MQEAVDATNAKISIVFVPAKFFLSAAKEALESGIKLLVAIPEHVPIRDTMEALDLAKKLGDDIDHRIQRYSRCICKSTFNFIEWLKEDYRKKLRAYLRSNFDDMFLKIHGRPPAE